MAHLCVAACVKDYFLALDCNNSSSALGEMESMGCTADKQEGTATPASNSKSVPVPVPVPVPCRQRAGGAALSIFQCTGETGTSVCCVCGRPRAWGRVCTHAHAHTYGCYLLSPCPAALAACTGSCRQPRHRSRSVCGLARLQLQPAWERAYAVTPLIHAGAAAATAIQRI